MTRYAQFFYVSLNGFNKLNPPRQITWQSDFRKINKELVWHREKILGLFNNGPFGHSVSFDLRAGPEKTAGTKKT